MCIHKKLDLEQKLFRIVGPSPSRTRTLKNGFTLIELLVVVLVIGVLAAVAVPQYQVAVYKSRAAELLINVRATHSAAKVYYMANGLWPTDWTTLEVDLPYEYLRDDGGANARTNGWLFMKNGNNYMLDVDGYVGGRLADGRIHISASFEPYTTGMFAGTFFCRCKINDKAANQACQSLGGVFNVAQEGVSNVYRID